ncbi:MAG TPA: nuclear transport factor 2 family protein [Polyangiaceae bacterium]|nr:nuclear transport factor 2 family protein [Polyangiaceae bacterium]
MKNNLRGVWERYVAAWKVASAAEKRQIFATCLAPACVYTDPLTRAEGWDALERYMTSFHGQIPGGHFVTEQFWEHHGKSVARWKMVDGAGLPLGEGISYAEYDDEQRLVAMTGFFDVPGSPQPA